MKFFVLLLLCKIHTDALIARFVALHIMCSLSTATKIIPTFCFCTERMHTLVIENTFFVYAGSHWSALHIIYILKYIQWVVTKKCVFFLKKKFRLHFVQRFNLYLYSTFFAYSPLLSCIHLDKHRDHFRSVLNYVHKMHRSGNRCLICRCCYFLKFDKKNSF